MSKILSEIKLSDDEEVVRLTFDDGTKLRISSYDWYGLSFGRKKGEVSDAEFESLLRIEECSKAKYKLLSLLSYSGNSRKGFALKLKKYGFSEESIEYALDFAEEKKLINDAEYAEALAYELVEIKKYGPVRVKNEMYKHGVPDAIAKEMIAKYDIKDEKGLSVYDRNMYECAVSKAKGLNLSDKNVREKFLASLNRSGYEFSRLSKLKFTKK